MEVTVVLIFQLEIDFVILNSANSMMEMTVVHLMSQNGLNVPIIPNSLVMEYVMIIFSMQSATLIMGTVVDLMCPVSDIVVTAKFFIQVLVLPLAIPLFDFYKAFPT